jgi:glycosyltransferase involved in cell wall biosynthesis
VLRNVHQCSSIESRREIRSLGQRGDEDSWSGEGVLVRSSDDIADSGAVMFSVVIGTYNGARTLSMALDALEAQITEFSYEILVINDASTDSTVEIASRPSVRLINLELNQGHGHTLNVGLGEARGQFMAMMDDDCVPPQRWIQQLGIAWNSVGPDVTMIGGLVEPFETDTFNRRYVAFRRPLRHQEAQVSEDAGFWTRLRYQLSPPDIRSDPRPVYFTVGANMSVRVQSAREVGGFSETPGSGEEESLARPLRSRFGPLTVQLFPSIVMRHNFHPLLRDTFRRSRSYGRASGREWVRDRDVPSLAPLLPCATLVAALVAVVSPVSSLAVLILSPYILYRRWFTWLRAGGSSEAIVYPYVQAGEDLANNVGFAQGAWRELRMRRRLSKRSSRGSLG